MTRISKHKVTRTARTAVIHAFFLVLALFIIYPLLVMAMGALKSGAEMAMNPAGFPLNPTLNNFVRLWSVRAGVIARTLFNSVYISTTYTVIALFLSSLAAFAFAKFRFRGRDLVFILIISTMIIPMELTIPPLYLAFARIGWLDTYTVQILPHAAHAFPLFLYTQYMQKIPDAFIDAARIDGAKSFRIYRSIIFPTAAPATGALIILVFLMKWDDYLWPLIMVTREQVMPIMVLLPTLTDQDYVLTIPHELVLAGSAIVVIPLILVFLLFQDRFMASVTMGALKE